MQADATRCPIAPPRLSSQRHAPTAQELASRNPPATPRQMATQRSAPAATIFRWSPRHSTSAFPTPGSAGIFHTMRGRAFSATRGSGAAEHPRRAASLLSILHRTCRSPSRACRRVQAHPGALSPHVRAGSLALGSIRCEDREKLHRAAGNRYGIRLRDYAAQVMQIDDFYNKSTGRDLCATRIIRWYYAPL